MSILIIGSGIAAVSALKAIRQNDRKIKITVIANEAEPFYYRPMIPLVMNGTKGVEDSKMTFDPAKTYDAELVYGTAFSLDTGSRTIALANDKKLSYDKLLIASGSRPVIPRLKGIKGEGVFTLRTLEDAVKIRDYSDKLQDAAVIGAGFVGIKAAEALAKKGMKVTLIELLPTLLYSRIDKTASDIITTKLKREGIEIITQAEVKAILRDKGGRPRGLTLASGEIRTDMVIISAGTEPNMEFLKGSGIKFERGVLVDEYLRTSDSRVYAAGDVAQQKDLITGEAAVSALWGNAVEMGRIAGANLTGGKIKYDGILSVKNASDIGGAAFVSVGRVLDGMSSYDVYRRREEDGYWKLVFDGDRLVGTILLGDIGGAGIYANLIKNRIPIPDLKAIAIAGRLSYVHFMKAET